MKGAARQPGRKEGRKEINGRMHSRVPLIVWRFHEWLSANEGPQMRNSREVCARKGWPGEIAGIVGFTFEERRRSEGGEEERRGLERVGVGQKGVAWWEGRNGSRHGGWW